jgi:hypothetical protein
MHKEHFVTEGKLLVISVGNGGSRSEEDSSVSVNIVPVLN